MDALKRKRKMLVIILFYVASVAAQCTEDESCEEIRFPKNEAGVSENSVLEGHHLSEHTSSNHHGCFTRCINNCQCLSFNFKSDSGADPNCQLNEAASYTNPESIKQKTDWTYVEMARKYLTKPPWKSCSSDSCHNGCCQSSPCEHGGTCSEVCVVRARRFKCACPPGYTGHRCQKTLRSCHDILLSGRHENGIYQIRNETNGTLSVYCDFDSEPGAAWTLVQSYSLEKGQRGSVNDIFSEKPLFKDFPVNEDSPDDWSSYRLSLADMKLIRAHSTHWRATCEFPTIGIDFRDYFRALLNDYDGMKKHFNPKCKRIEFINVRGNQCIDCTAITITVPVSAPLLMSYNPSMISCDFDGEPNGGISGETNFGDYINSNPAFRCSATSDSTTQYWFGKM
ncbi:hypothetical protein ACROYT_G000679 [Oculina patagonica]